MSRLFRTSKNQLVEEALASGKVGPKYTRAQCPFCELERGRRTFLNLSINNLSGFYRCFRCSIQGRLDGYETETETAPKTSTLDPPQGYVGLGTEAGATSLALAPARRFARQRGLTAEICLELGIGATLDGKFSNRIIFPLIKEDQWVGYVGRAWYPDAYLKYILPEEMDRGNLYLEHLIHEDTEEPILVVEGCLDAISLYPRGVAVLGKPTEEHLSRLSKARRPVVFILDGDAWREGEACSLKLRLDGCTAGYVQLPSGYDPDEIDRQELLVLAEESIVKKL